MTHPLCAKMLEEKEQNLKLFFDANDNRCRYHSKNADKKEVNILSQGMCPVAYMNLYPALFALHLNHNESKLKINPREHVIQCPLGSDGITFKVYTSKSEFSLMGYLRNLIRRTANLFIPVEMYDKSTRIEAINEGKGCAFGITKGKKFYFNLDHTDELCPAAFNSVYPFLDTKQPDLLVGCPDYRTHVSFSTEEKPGNERDLHFCDNYSTKVKIDSILGSFDCPVKPGQWYSVDELIKIAGIRCFTSFHVAFPYFYVLYNGGQLGFLTGDRETAGICCPNTRLMVKYMVSKDSNGQYAYTCSKTHSECPRKLEINEEVAFDNFEKSLPFYKGLADLYPALRKLESDKGLSGQEMKISSINDHKGIIWLISRDTK